MKAFIFACIISAFCAVSQSTPYNLCDNGPPPVKLRVEGCDSSPCYIYKGTNLTAQWDFTADADAQSLAPQVIVYFMGTTVNYPYPEKNACNSLVNSKCPLKKNSKATYNLEMPISKAYPSLALNIQFALIDENKNIQVCFSLDCEVTDKKILSSSL
ncbi:Epididymal secretory protein E1 [Camponotus floridanus]|uniref:Epididymal secretory protein E1 n=1 Tax=Camponotus floridanus TaxID=104421 RepID=E2AIZ6_CAMFO|nr:NPC intracellular cholesterol transporter 2 [Camponotus floridanus]EFN66585.1 Epididymal secretory protein E1 [Camponotus floridanus]